MERRAKYGVLECKSCEHEFADRLPPLYEELPACPACGGETKMGLPLFCPFDRERSVG